VLTTVVILYTLYYWRFKNPHFLIKNENETRKKNIGRPPPPYPNGWYNITEAHSLKVGHVRSVDIAGQNIVLYRGKDNVAYALEAYCLHMGANLAVGGEVVNETCIQCPFHGWLYEGKSGHCVGI
jgi:cholesterol 7-dehydrogenase